MGIPTILTDWSLNDNIIELMRLIAECKSDIVKSQDAIAYTQGRLKQSRDALDIERFRQTLEHGVVLASETLPYQQAIGGMSIQINNESARMEENRKKISEYKIKIRELEGLLRMPEMERAEARYRSLMKRVTVNDANELRELSEEFREMEGYSDTAELARKYENKACELENQAEYNQLVEEKKQASSAYAYQKLAERFRTMNGYKNTAELSKECDNRYSELKQRLEIEYNKLVEMKNKASTEGEYQDIAKRFRWMNDYKNTSELANECDIEYKKCKESREEQDEVKKKKQYTAIVSGVICGVVSCLLAGFLATEFATDRVLSFLVSSFGICVGILTWYFVSKKRNLW